MSDRANGHPRCARCRMLGDLCVCALIPNPRLETRTRVVLFIHRYEARKPTNTGQLALECLANRELVVLGHPGQPTARFTAPPGTQPLLLTPHGDPAPLVRPAMPVTLIVPDGTWRQAAKMSRRVPGLADVPCVSLPPGDPTRYRLRSEPQPGGLATLEAIARALEILEGPHLRHALERVFDAMVERTLQTRGARAAG